MSDGAHQARLRGDSHAPIGAQLYSFRERAKSDVEVFRISDVEGLTPLLEILTEKRGAAAPQSAAKADTAPAKPLAIAGPTNTG